MSKVSTKTVVLIGALSCVGAMIGAEIYFRTFGEQRFTATSSRYVQPYIGFADFVWFQDRPQKPEDFGYRSERGLFLFRDKKDSPVLGHADRLPNLIEWPIDETKKILQDKKNLVFVLGGSAALGDRHTDSKNRVFVRLESELNERFPQSSIQVLPAGIRAFVSTQERVLFDLYIAPVKPKAVFFLHGFNDFNNYFYFSRPGDPYGQGIEYSRAFSGGFRFASFLSEWSVSYSRWYISNKEDYLSGQAYTFRKHPERIETYMRGAANIYIENVEWMAGTCEQRKIHCFFLLQPKLWDPANPIAVGYEMVRARFKKSNLNTYAHFFDLEPRYRERKEFFMDEVHMADPGQIDLAKEITNLAVPHLKNTFDSK